MLRGSTTLLSAPPGGVPAHAPPPRSRRHASRRSARQKCHNQNSRATRRPPPKKRKGRQKRRPSSQGGVCGERVKQTGVPPACMGSKGESRRAQMPDNAHLRSKIRITAIMGTAQCLATTHFFDFLRRLVQPSNWDLSTFV